MGDTLLYIISAVILVLILVILIITILKRRQKRYYQGIYDNLEREKLNWKYSCTFRTF